MDCLLKKFKSKLFKSVHIVMCKCLNLNILRLPQSFITNIKIKFNKYWLNMTIQDIYKEYNVLCFSISDLISKNLIKPRKRNLLEEFLLKTYSEVVQIYLTSIQFSKDYEAIVKKDGNNYALLFILIAHIFSDYYINSRGNKTKGNKIVAKSDQLVYKKTLLFNI